MYAHKGVSVRRLLCWADLQTSSFYYKASGSSKGIKPSTHSVDIEQTLSQEFCCYGYHNLTGELKEKGWIINHKKVYRLMREHKLLGKHPTPSGTNILIRSLLKTKNYSITFEKPSSL